VPRSTLSVPVRGPGANAGPPSAAAAFSVEEAGPPDGPLVVLLHGFPQTADSWRHQVPALAAAGYHALAPDQRGYSAGARPDPAELAHYATGQLVADVLALADAAAGAGRPFHLVGHDWGGQVAWLTAMAHPDRVSSLCVLSRPHPSAFVAAMRGGDPAQAQRSRHHKAFLDPATTDVLLADGARRLRRTLTEQGVPEASIAEYLAVLGDRLALDAALAWYRAAAGDFGPGAAAPSVVTVPTLYLWGDADASVGRVAAEGTAAHVTGPYRMVELAGVGHFVTDQVPERVTELLLDHLAHHG
jgi:pimeloyl-ACP methyl ester carboxylesterase